jgi:phospholipid transport system substrate-binding protein
MATPLIRRALLLGSILGLGLTCLLAPGSSEAGPPTDMLRAVFGDANKVLTDPTTEERPAERIAAIRVLFSRIFDFRDAAERALGPQWKTRTSAEQNEFTRLFADFVQRGFVYWLASVAEVDSRGSGVTVAFLSESLERDVAKVPATILSRGGRTIQITYDMAYRSRRWVVRDITIEGVSLVGSYRAQFDRVIRASSYPELVARMRARINESPFPSSVDPGAPATVLPARGTHIETR